MSALGQKRTLHFSVTGWRSCPRPAIPLGLSDFGAAFSHPWPCGLAAAQLASPIRKSQALAGTAIHACARSAILFYSQYRFRELIANECRCNPFTDVPANCQGKESIAPTERVAFRNFVKSMLVHYNMHGAINGRFPQCLETKAIPWPILLRPLVIAQVNQVDVVFY